MFSQEQFCKSFEDYLAMEYGKTSRTASAHELHGALARCVLALKQAQIQGSENRKRKQKRACYLSAEFLIGRMAYNNLLALGLLEQVSQVFQSLGRSLNELEEIEDAALGNGGLGRLAACFLDSAATRQIPLDGYGIRYRYGLFKQVFKDGKQVELADDWSRHGDPWSVRREDEAVTVVFGDQEVSAVPYDMPVFGYGTDYVGRLRLWQSEPILPFDFAMFNDQKYSEAVREKNRAEDISRVLYPNDDTDEGKALRIKQEYFFTSASMQDIVRTYVEEHGRDFTQFARYYAVQINDTHPVLAIPETIRIFMNGYNMDFVTAFSIAKEVFSYTNHTIMAEALESWSIELLQEVVPQIYEIVLMINEHLIREFSSKRVSIGKIREMKIIAGGRVHMARLALFSTHCTNGVAEIHTQILKERTFKDWHILYPERLQNKTNGVTQRRWLALCNPELSAMISGLLGDDSWITRLDQLRGLEKYCGDPQVLGEFRTIKKLKKRQLSHYIAEREGVELNPDFVFDIQIKRLHEYKRQLLNAFSILDIYYGIKEGRITGFCPTAFIFGAKAAPGYRRAKGIIKYINEIARLIDSDPQVKDLMKVVFVQNYNVTYAEKLIPAADISEQISTAGTEASGTGNMKLMLNGAVTLGTYDGANIEIVEEAGLENNYIFGARVEEIDKIRESYDPKVLYRKSPRIARVLDTLIDNTFSDGRTGDFAELYNALLDGASWHRPDQYFLLHDFESYVDAKLTCIRETGDVNAFAAKCLRNVAGAGKFSSDRTIEQYAREVWGL